MPIRTLCILLCAMASIALAQDGPYVGRPVYRDRHAGWQMPPGCLSDPSWRAPVRDQSIEIWLAQCPDGAHAWVVDAHVVEREANVPVRWRYEILDDHALARDLAGETASVQCTDTDTGLPAVVLGARWQGDARLLSLVHGRASLRLAPSATGLVESGLRDLDCARFPEREKALQQLHANPVSR